MQFRSLYCPSRPPLPISQVLLPSSNILRLLSQLLIAKPWLVWFVSLRKRLRLHPPCVQSCCADPRYSLSLSALWLLGWKLYSNAGRCSALIGRLGQRCGDTVHVQDILEGPVAVLSLRLRSCMYSSSINLPLSPFSIPFSPQKHFPLAL